MTLAGKLILSTTLLTLLTTALLGLGVRQAWRNSEERRFVEQFQTATRELQAELHSQTEELHLALKARCVAEPSVESGLIGLKAGDLEDRRLGLSVQVAALTKSVRADELVLVASNAEVLGAGHAPELVGQRSEALRALILALKDHGELRKTTSPPSIHASCVRRDRSRLALWVGLYGVRHLDRILKDVGTRHALDLAFGAATPSASDLVQSEVLEGLGGIPVTASQSRRPLLLAVSELDATVLIIAAVTLLLASGMAYLLSRGIARPIEELSEQARRIAVTDPKPVVARGSRELQDLAHAFNQTLSDLAQSRTQLLKAERIAAQREIARRVAHEIKNPLSPIRAAIETLRRLRSRADPAFDDYFDEATRTVLSEVARISKIVNEFTEFARLPEPQPRDVDLELVLTDLLTLHRAEGTTIHADLKPGVCVHADRDQLIQVLTNLIKNAQEAAHASEAPEIWVSLRQLSATAELSVRDNGPGLAPEVEARLFEPYVTSKPDGTGLGLAIAERIVSEHGGKIRHQRPKGGGAEFIVELPLKLKSDGSREASPGPTT